MRLWGADGLALPPSTLPPTAYLQDSSPILRLESQARWVIWMEVLRPPGSPQCSYSPANGSWQGANMVATEGLAGAYLCSLRGHCQGQPHTW